MNPIYHDMRSYRKKTCLTLQDVADLLGTRDISKISRQEIRPITPQVEICLLYHLLFKVPITTFFATQLEQIKQKLVVRIPNLVDSLKVPPTSQGDDEKIEFLTDLLETLSISSNL